MSDPARRYKRRQPEASFTKPLAPTLVPARGTAGYFRPYDLRHTAATLLIYAGRTINEVAEHLGHADPGFTARTYTHIYRDADKRRGISIEEAIRLARQDTEDAKRPGAQSQSS